MAGSLNKRGRCWVPNITADDYSGVRFLKGEQFPDRDTECVSDAVNRIQGRVAPAPFDAAEVGDVDSSTMGHLLLSEAHLPAQGTKVDTKGYGIGDHGNLTMSRLAVMLWTN